MIVTRPLPYHCRRQLRSRPIRPLRHKPEIDYWSAHATSQLERFQTGPGVSFVSGLRTTRGGTSLYRLGDRLDMLGRGAAAATDDADQAVLCELAERLRHSLRGSSSYSPNFIRETRTRIGADQRIGDPREFGDNGAASLLAPSAQLRPTENGAGVAERIPEGGRASGPTASAPDRSVMVPEIISGRAHFFCGEDLLGRHHRRLGVERVEDRLDQDQVGAVFDQTLASASE